MKSLLVFASIVLWVSATAAEKDAKEAKDEKDSPQKLVTTLNEFYDVLKMKGENHS